MDGDLFRKLDHENQTAVQLAPPTSPRRRDPFFPYNRSRDPFNQRREATMDFRVIDYSPVLFNEGLPSARQGKFLQVVENGETELLILSPYGLSKFHAQILERFCTMNDLDGRFLRKPEYYLASGAGIEVIGGGHWKIDESIPMLVLEGESTVYGRFNPDGLSAKVRILPEYRGYEVVIR
jgi:hypothetical protein